MYRHWPIPAIIPAVILLTSCSSSPEGMFVDYCKNITVKLVSASEISWSDSRQTETSGKELRVDLSYTSDGNPGKSSCLYAYEESQDVASDGEYETAPYKVILDNKEVSQIALIKATGGVAIQAVKESGKHIDTMADQASEKARNIAYDAAGKVKEAAGDVQDALEK